MILEIIMLLSPKTSCGAPSPSLVPTAYFICYLELDTYTLLIIIQEVRHCAPYPVQPSPTQPSPAQNAPFVLWKVYSKWTPLFEMERRIPQGRWCFFHSFILSFEIRNSINFPIGINSRMFQCSTNSMAQENHSKPSSINFLSMLENYLGTTGVCGHLNFTPHRRAFLDPPTLRSCDW